MTEHTIHTRRTVLSGIVSGAVVAMSGCLGDSESDDPDSVEDDDTFEDVFVEGTDLVLEFAEDASVDHVNVVDPGGELYAERTIPTGVNRETIEIGTSYIPGEYEIVALEDEEEQSTQTIAIEPDIHITDLRLGRNHPDEMFEGASDREIRAETILKVENRGTGPELATRLSFDGDVPRQSPDDFEESGIVDTDSSYTRHADSIELPPNEEVILYSRRRPFSSATDRISCSPDTESGTFEVAVETQVLTEPVTAAYEVQYTGEDLVDCDIEIEVA